MYWLKKYRYEFRDYFFIALGSAAQSVALIVFLVPANLTGGGVSGAAQLISYGTGWPIGLMTFLGNLPLFVLGWRLLGGPRFAMRTIFSIIVFSLVTDLLPLMPAFPHGGVTDDVLLNALYGGVISGMGYGLVYKGQGTSGGSDILARILNYWRGIPMPQSYLLSDAVVVVAFGLVFGWKEALYTLISLYASGISADTVVDGGGTVRTAMIITSSQSHAEDIRQKILNDMIRGVTMLDGTGGWTGNARPVLYCVITRSEVQQLKTLVHEVDARAFMVVGAAHEAIGEGFQSFKRGS